MSSRFGADLAGPEAQRDDHWPGSIRVPGRIRRRRASRGDRHRGVEPARLRQRAGHLRQLGNRPGRYRAGNRLGEAIYHQLQRLPEQVSTKAKWFDPELRANLAGLRANPDWYRIYGGFHDEGAVIVSQLDEAVDFHTSLSGRVANLVPIDDVSHAVRAMNSYTRPSVSTRSRCGTRCATSRPAWCSAARFPGIRGPSEHGGPPGRHRATATNGEVDRRRALRAE